jgi:hypothetical protein
LDLWHQNVIYKWWGKPGVSDAEKDKQELQIKMAAETLTGSDLAAEAAKVAVSAYTIIGDKSQQGKEFAGRFGEDALKVIMDKEISEAQSASNKTSTSPQPSLESNENIIVDIGSVE